MKPIKNYLQIKWKENSNETVECVFIAFVCDFISGFLNISDYDNDNQISVFQ